MSYFDAALEWTLANEGSRYTDDPDDAGGPTKYGITLRAYQSLYPGAVPPEVEGLTYDRAADFYRKTFWKALLGDEILDRGAAIMLFDISVLTGPRRTMLNLQKNLRVLPDGTMGPETLKALNNAGDNLPRILGEVWSDFLLYLVNTAVAKTTNERYLRGWVDRALRQLPLFAYRPSTASK